MDDYRNYGRRGFVQGQPHRPIGLSGRTNGSGTGPGFNRSESQKDGGEAKDVPIGHVTNGVHPRTWLAHEADAL